MHTEIAVGILPCPSSGHGTERAFKFGEDYGGLMKCHSDTFNAEIQDGSWIGNYTPPGTNKAQRVAGICLYCMLTSIALKTSTSTN